MKLTIGVALFVLSCAVAFPAKKDPPLDMTVVKAESNLEKRAEKAMEYASQSIDRARAAYRDGQLKEALAQVEEVGAAVELAHQSLIDTGKNPSKSPKHFKRAELKTREMVRRLDSLANDMNFDERDPVEKTRSRVQKVNEALLTGIMTGKKK